MSYLTVKLLSELSGQIQIQMIRLGVPETQEDASHVVQNDVIEDRNCCAGTGIIKDSHTSPDDQQINKILTIIENFHSSPEAVEKRFMKIEDHMIGFSNPIPATNPNTMQDNFYTNLLKNWISELEKQIAD